MFTSFILKLTGYCNLDCSYCYMFNTADRTFTRKPRAMSIETAARTIDAIAEHARRIGRERVEVTLHGGEPTLWPVAGFRAICDRVDHWQRLGTAIDLDLQSNLFKMPPAELLDLWQERGLSIGVSLDGPRAFNDAARVDFRGKGSYDRVIGNVNRLIAEGRGALVNGFLCVTQPDIPPDIFLQWVADLPVPRVNLLWPLEVSHANPPAPGARTGRWLADLFDAWIALDREDIEIVRFHHAMRAVLGGGPSSDDLGPWAMQSLVVNTDGALELTDYFRPSSDGAAETGFSVHHHRLEDVAASLPYQAHLAAARRLPDACRACPHAAHCAGGTLAGRFDAQGRITPQPSVLCPDHKLFFDTVLSRLDAARAA